MDKKLESKRSMYYVVEENLSTVPASTLEQLPNFNVLYGEFRELVNSIRDQSEMQTFDRRGEAMTKNEVKELMVQRASNVSNRVKAYALSINNLVLAEEMSKPYSKLLKLADTVCADVCEFIHDKAKSIQSELEPFGISEELLNKLKETIDRYTVLLPRPRQSIIERKTATRNILRIFNRVDQKLASMDVLVDMLRFDNVDFYEQYYASRKIIAHGRRKLSVLGILRDQYNNPVPLATVRIEGTKIEAKSGEKGFFEFKNLKDGVYKITFEKAGYDTVEREVAVTVSERADMKVTMYQTVQLQLAV